ncbi:malate dehydrogenase (quinone) [Rhodococcus sp. G-MC3]|uniref:malate dehydrogenase (quinone) n=1 Tax=Rhodococcus sp. G-MC3 TaxID=3046209 RepID=UPI0024B95CAF|nr:malate dehydrogenase (quinone) [Rhodococcus sp. G-MC3]MDJ0393652.1 malate dehydrogenase (quinone) [Rhodococcus sp. G-MC3]
MTSYSNTRYSKFAHSEILDVALIGGGIMSATLGAMLGKLMPDKTIALFERLDHLAGESSGAWNNAGTGHSGLCELNYMPDPEDSSRTHDIADQFQLSQEFWAALGSDRFVTPTPHLNVVFGDDDTEYLRRRWEALRRIPHFAAMEYTEDPDLVREWAPLLMEGRESSQKVAATRHEGGKDVDFGAITAQLAETMTARGALIRTGHEVTGLRRDGQGMWTVTGRIRTTGAQFSVRARFVFVGAGGYALRLLQKSRIPEIRGYGVFPFGAEFLRTDDPSVVARHNAKVYGKPSLGAPPMSLPHLDRRAVEGSESLMFGPYATFGTRLLKHGRFTDLFTTVRPRNLPILLSVGMRNLPLVRYLIGQLVASKKTKFAELRKYYPDADPANWYPIGAGQRAQLVKPTSRTKGTLMFGTEIVTGADGTIAGLLGASPGASVAPAAMIDVLNQCFDAERDEWQPRLEAMIPSAIGRQGSQGS